MSGQTKTYVYDGGGSSIDPALIALLSQNGGFGNGANWMWPMFMYMMFPWLFGGMGMGFGGLGGFGGGAGLLGTGYLANQMTNDSNVNTLLQALGNRADAINQLATILNTNVGNVQNGINALQSAIQGVSNLTGMTGQQIINSIQNGNASLSQQLCQCCCDNRLAICEQTNTLQRQAADNYAATQLQMAKNEAADQLGMCQQTNQLGSQADRNKQEIKDAIAAQSVMINDKFCDLEKRELQAKIDALVASNSQLRGQIDNGQQTATILGQVNAQLAPIMAEVQRIAAKQPNTIPVQWPNIQAVNTTPNYPGGYPGGYYPGSFWG